MLSVYTLGYKTIRVSDEEYDMVVKARNELANRGLNSLNKLSVDIPKKEMPDLSNFALGAVVGIGIAALIALLAESSD